MESGRLVHAAILRDGFVAASALLLVLAIISLFTAYPFLRRLLRREQE